MPNLRPGIVVRDVGGELRTRIVMPVGHHDATTVREFQAALSGAVDAGRPVIVDMRRTTFADSSFLGSIIMAVKRAGRRRLAVVVPPTGAVAQLFGMVDVHALFETFPSPRLASEWIAADSGGETRSSD